MQNDLISRSALIEVLKADEKQDRSRAYGEHECNLIAGTIAMCIDSVKAMPTAYSVEKVLAEIGLLDFKTHRVMRETGINSEVFETVRVDKYVRLYEVLDIIRNGGKV